MTSSRRTSASPHWISNGGRPSNLPNNGLAYGWVKYSSSLSPRYITTGCRWAVGPGVGTISYAALVSQDGQLRVRSIGLLTSVLAGEVRPDTYQPTEKIGLRLQVADNRYLGDTATMLGIDHLLHCHPPIQHFLQEHEDPP